MMRKVLLLSNLVLAMCIQVCRGQYTIVPPSDNPEKVILVSPITTEPVWYCKIAERPPGTLYDSFSNILQYQIGDGINVTCLWGYNYSYPVAKIENATYGQVIGVLGVSYEQLQTKSSTELETIFQALRGHLKMKDAMIYSYTYSSLEGMTSATSPAGIKTAYEYDDDGHLCNVRVRWSDRLVQEP